MTTRREFLGKSGAVAGLAFVGCDLLTQVWGCIEQHPVFAVAADCDRRLGSRRKPWLSSAHACAVAAVTIPLRETATSGRPQNLDDHVS